MIQPLGLARIAPIDPVSPMQPLQAAGARGRGQPAPFRWRLADTYRKARSRYRCCRTLARRMRAGRGLISLAVRRRRHFAGRMRAGRGLPCPRHPLGRARLPVAPTAPTVRGGRPGRRAAACAPQLLGVQLVRDVARARPVMGRVKAVRVAGRGAGRLVARMHPLVRRAGRHRRCWHSGWLSWRGNSRDGR
jgi:hypothetical protein